MDLVKDRGRTTLRRGVGPTGRVGTVEGRTGRRRRTPVDKDRDPGPGPLRGTRGTSTLPGLRAHSKLPLCPARSRPFRGTKTRRKLSDP